MKKLFIVYVHITPDGMYYYGVTNNIKERFRPSAYKTTSLRPYIEKYGWENIQHIVLFENQSKEDALSIEDSLILSSWEKGNCINQQRSGYVTNEEEYYIEYYKQNKDKLKEYREQHKEEHKEYNREYYKQNKDKIKQYREDNKDKIKAQSKQYYEDNKDKIKQYREQNKDKIKAQSKQYYKENRNKIREYQRKYRQRKKEESQLKELGYIPLF